MKTNILTEIDVRILNIRKRIQSTHPVHFSREDVRFLISLYDTERAKNSALAKLLEAPSR